MNSLSQIDRQKVFVLALVGVLFAVAFAWLINQNEVMLRRSDFLQGWWAAGKLLGEGRNLYDAQNGIELVDFGRLGIDPLGGNYYYPAHLVLLLAPFTLLPYPLAHLLWTALGLISFFAGSWMVLRETGWPATLNRATLFLLLATLFVPTFQHTIWSQFNAIGLLAFGLTLLALGNGRFLQAGAWAAFMTIKPQSMLLVLGALLIWSLLRRARWRFMLGFGLAAGSMWLIAELLQPGWVLDFWRALRAYDAIPIFDMISVLDWFWNPYQIPALLLGLGWLAVVWDWRSAEVGSAQFRLMLVFSMGISWLITPIIGMLHMIAAPAAIALLLAGLSELDKRSYRLALWLLGGVYLLGWVGFVYGLAIGGRLHIDLAEMAYKLGLPLALAGISLQQLFVFKVAGNQQT